MTLWYFLSPLPVQSRDGTLQIPPKASFHTRCIFTEGGVKCGDRIIPCSKYCRKHILEDKKQVLFRACSIEKAGVVCKEPVPGIFEDATCILHIQLPPQRNYVKKKYESDSDDDSTPANNSLPQIKKEDSDVAEPMINQSTNDKTHSHQHDSDHAPVVGDKNVTICHDDNIEQKPPTNNSIKAETMDKWTT